jgi:hypothetical protein
VEQVVEVPQLGEAVEVLAAISARVQAAVLALEWKILAPA